MTASIPSSDQAPCTGGVIDLQENENDDTDETAHTSDAEVAVESGTVVAEKLGVEGSALADLTTTAEADDRRGN